MTRNRYPTATILSDGRRVIVRPFQADDAVGLHDFFLGLPVDWRRFAWDRIESRGLIERWADNIDYDRVLPLLAFDGPRVVADASLHRRDHGPLRLVGRVKWLIDPEFREVGLGTMLVNLLMDAARDMGLRHVTCMLISELESDAIEVLKRLGFKEYRIPDYGVDPDGAAHDMSKLVFSF
ncbi:MAG: N-acetyltransferase [Acidobacteria bacterium]|nr:MAG: N-acetyltransferase [Acidobacteriota bacterium]